MILRRLYNSFIRMLGFRAHDLGSCVDDENSTMQTPVKRVYVPSERERFEILKQTRDWQIDHSDQDGWIDYDDGITRY